MSQYGEHSVVTGFVADTKFVGVYNDSGLKKQRQNEKSGQTQPNTNSTHSISPTHTHTHAQTRTSINASLRLIFSKYPRILQAFVQSDPGRHEISMDFVPYMHHHEWQIHDTDVLLFAQGYE